MILPLSSQLKCKGIWHFICLNVSLIGCFLQILWYKATNYMLKWELATRDYSRFTPADLLRKMFSPCLGRNTAFLIQGRSAETDVMTVLPFEFSLNKMDLTGFFVPLKIYRLKVMKANPVHFHCVHLFFASVEAGRGVKKKIQVGDLGVKLYWSLLILQGVSIWRMCQYQNSVVLLEQYFHTQKPQISKYSNCNLCSPQSRGELKECLVPWGKYHESSFIFTHSIFTNPQESGPTFWNQYEGQNEQPWQLQVRRLHYIKFYYWYFGLRQKFYEEKSSEPEKHQFLNIFAFYISLVIKFKVWN